MVCLGGQASGLSVGLLLSPIHAWRNIASGTAAVSPARQQSRGGGGLLTSAPLLNARATDMDRRCGLLDRGDDELLGRADAS